ncbi:MAG: hypothetical protein ACI8U4_000456 [Natronomonas sp.]|jgi:hypothetical protein
MPNIFLTILVSKKHMGMGDAVGEPADAVSEAGLDGVSNMLVLSPTMDEAARAAYYERLLPDAIGSTDVLAIDYRQTPDQWMEEWKRRVGERPRRCTIVSVDEATRSVSGKSNETTQRGPNTVTCLKSPTDLTGLGITISEYLADEGGEQTIVTFDSLTVLLQYVDLQRAFRFLHVLSNRVKTVDATAYYHMDPGAHDDKDVATLTSLFDATAEFEDGSWSIHGR